jgi:ribosomal-protein-alanine N-acetyltransferase
MTGRTRSTSREELRSLWPAVSAAHLFGGFAGFEQWWAEAPWRVRIADTGDAAVLGRWREHLPILSVQGLWCPTRRIPMLLADLRDVAREQGFDRLLGPLVPAEAVGPYLAAGLEVTQRIVVCRTTVPAPAERQLPCGVVVREGGPSDAEAVLALDHECFDDFWRYDPETIRELATAQRMSLATRGGDLIGYTLSTVIGAEATVARLAVAQSERRRGVGRALLREAAAGAAARGARAITLCTQEENKGSRRLYRQEGFRESPGRLVGTLSRPL